MSRTKNVRYAWVPFVALTFAGAVAGGCGSDPAAAPTPVKPAPNPPPDQPVIPPPDNTAPLADGSDIGGYPSAEKCKGCHEKIYDEWKTSMHSHAASSPVTIAQVNQVVSEELSNDEDSDVQHFCTNCHGPIPTQITDSTTLPFVKEPYSEAALNEGITCVTCHKYNVNAIPLEGYGALGEFQNNFNSGPFMFGPFDDAKENKFHESAQNGLLADDEDSDKFCASCHQVGIDKDGDNLLRVGTDFVLQNLNQEYLAYRDAGGRETCVSCHMPERTGQAAQVTGAPQRKIRSHVFVGVDYPIDEVAAGTDNLQSARETLLKSAAQLNIENIHFANNVLNSFDVTIENSGSGHNIPSGFAFMRQAWLEVRVTDQTGQLDIFDSGVLRKESDDLCDDNTIKDRSPLSAEVVGCDNVQQDADPFLVNLQTKLLDNVVITNGQVVAGPGAKEYWLQLLTGGAVVRVRTQGGGDLTPLVPNETRTFSYPVGPLTALAGSKIQVRLLFRNLPPYMVRKLGKNQSRGELQIEPLVGALKVTEMASREVTLQ